MYARTECPVLNGMDPAGSRLVGPPFIGPACIAGAIAVIKRFLQRSVPNCRIGSTLVRNN